MEADHKNEQYDQFFALMIRNCAARQRGDEAEDERTSNVLDTLWHNGAHEAESIWKDACLWIAQCVAKWPSHNNAET